MLCTCRLCFSLSSSTGIVKNVTTFTANQEYGLVGACRGHAPVAGGAAGGGKESHEHCTRCLCQPHTS